MEFVSEYIEMMGDMEFALYTGIFVFSVILFLGLLAKLIGTKGAATPVLKGKESKRGPGTSVESKTDVSPETFLASVEKKNIPTAAQVSAQSVVQKADTSAPTVPATAKNPGPAPTVPVNSLEGAMMWDGDSGKKKKGKILPLPPSAPARVLPPGYVDPKTPPAKEKESEKTVVLSAPAKENPAVAAPPDEIVAPVVSAKPEPPAVAPQPKPEPTADEPDGKPAVDFHMYETLVRRIAGLETEIKKDPLYLDPLMRRVSLSEKKLEDLSEKVKTPIGTLAPAQTGSVSAGLENEVKVLREKVDRLQKILEQLAEGPSNGALP